MLIFAGAAATASRTYAVAQFVSRRVASIGSRPILRDVADLDIPLLHADDESHDSLSDLQDQAAKADALVWVTPCYHGSYSGALKNALDHLREEDLRGKPVGLIAVGTSLTAVQACDHLRSVARALGCVAAPTHTVVTSSPGAPGTDDVQEGDGQRIFRMVSELHALADATWQLRQDRAPMLTSYGADS
ncbi:NAD(P)H-dependent oxidoreductase [Streptomyces sp. DW26H14]|uniref:NAD(P)H-dependent oxidoreductase n=1 Tax=Streptomyces sp. DW26H14 TaxID=3435395 RepID=UPI00403D9F3F